MATLSLPESFNAAELLGGADAFATKIQSALTQGNETLSFVFGAMKGTTALQWLQELTSENVLAILHNEHVGADEIVSLTEATEISAKFGHTEPGALQVILFARALRQICKPEQTSTEQSFNTVRQSWS